MSGKYLNGRYPQNFIIHKPLAGGLIIAVFGFLFMILYRPLGSKAAHNLTYEMTMALYNIGSGVAALIAIISVRSVKWFRNEHEWTILKELVSVLIVITATSMSIYFLGFIIEEPSSRWNFATFFDSVLKGFLIGVVPFTFFILVNYRYLFPGEIIPSYPSGIPSGSETTGQVIRISSQLKKESLSFYPSELLYAESDGNYVIFYLEKDKQVKKEIIRNSINNIEQQFSGIPFLFRTHRAFIVNLKKVTARHGTTLGYTLKLSGTEMRIPVSRTYTKEFNKALSSLAGE